ncbi:MAG: DNA-binding protein [Ruminococcus sp.]|jgi:predicted DNA-binding protein YlxM (UPF0122 family)|nr:DNA-binding protein [Ruminococcus sp.]
MEADEIKSLRYSRLLDYYSGCLTEKQAEAAKSFYNDDLSLGEIAENSGISRQAVFDNIKRAEAIMQGLEDKLHILEHADRYYKLFDELKKHLTVLENELKPGCNISALHSRAKHTLGLLEGAGELF